MQSFLQTKPQFDNTTPDRCGASALAASLRRIPDEAGSNDVLKKIVVQILVATESDELRNAAAIALVDLKASEEAAAIIEVIRRPELASRCGSLLFALDQLGVSLPLDLLVQIIGTGSFEARAEALLFVEAGRLLLPSQDELPGLISELEDFQSRNDDDMAEAAQVVLTHMGHMSPGPSVN